MRVGGSQPSVGSEGPQLPAVTAQGCTIMQTRHERLTPHSCSPPHTQPAPASPYALCCHVHGPTQKPASSLDNHGRPWATGLPHASLHTWAVQCMVEHTH
jgi:hypothetical protein